METIKYLAGKKAVSDKLGAAADKAGELATTSKKVGSQTRVLTWALDTSFAMDEVAGENAECSRVPKFNSIYQQTASAICHDIYAGLRIDNQSKMIIYLLVGRHGQTGEVGRQGRGPRGGSRRACG